MKPALDRRAVLAGAVALAAGGCAQTQERVNAPVVPGDRMMYPRPGDETGFTSLFDGSSLQGWDGDPRHWRVENGAIVGEVTPDRLLQSNTFLVWRGGEPRDFELKMQCRLSRPADGAPNSNSGINYRSVLVNDEITPTNQFALRGLQFDMDGRDNYTGNIYEERGRSFIAMRGQVVHTNVDGSRIVGTVGEAAALRAALATEWRDYHIIAQGTTLYHLANGQLMAAAIDSAPSTRRSNLIGMQVHMGPPMKVEFRNVRLRQR